MSVDAPPPPHTHTHPTHPSSASHFLPSTLPSTLLPLPLPPTAVHKLPQSSPHKASRQTCTQTRSHFAPPPLPTRHTHTHTHTYTSTPLSIRNPSVTQSQTPAERKGRRRKIMRGKVARQSLYHSLPPLFPLSGRWNKEG